MSEQEGDVAPGDSSEEHADTISSYAIGLGLAALLTVLSFALPGMSSLIWAPAIPAALIALAIAQMGVHLVFFLHIDTGPDNTNNTLALAFGVLIVFLVVAGSVWIMSHLNGNMMPMDQVMQMQR
jgi:cytochrome o ubiquinol oxidase operon protein cyoD